MKTIIILGDGMADYPVEELDGKTPLQFADTPAMDWIAKNGKTGLFKTLDEDLPKGSAVANLAVLGYDPHVTFQGRGVLEAASLGVVLKEQEIALRVNLMCIEDGKIKSHSAGHITDAEAGELIRAVQEHFKGRPFNFTQGLSYRHLLVLEDGDPAVDCAPPHDHVGETVESLMIKAMNPKAEATANLLNALIKESWEVLENHPVNLERKKRGQQPANSLWPWSPGRKPEMKTFKERFGVTGAVISAVDLIKGLGVFAGLDVIDVEGATGLYDTNYEGKADAAVKALETHDFVYTHVEAADEAGHDRNAALKVRCIEDLDQRLIARIMDQLGPKINETIIAVLPDHPTPVIHGAHARDPVPVAIYVPGETPDAVQTFDEFAVKEGKLGMMHGEDFIRHALHIKN